MEVHSLITQHAREAVDTMLIGFGGITKATTSALSNDIVRGIVMSLIGSAIGAAVSVIVVTTRLDERVDSVRATNQRQDAQLLRFEESTAHKLEMLQNLMFQMLRGQHGDVQGGRNNDRNYVAPFFKGRIDLPLWQVRIGTGTDGPRLYGPFGTDSCALGVCTPDQQRVPMPTIQRPHFRQWFEWTAYNRARC